MRICSFLPSATEMLFALGLGEEVVGVTYACDFPEEAREKPVVVKTRLPETGDSGELDATVKEYISRRESLYSVDDRLLTELQPDLIVTQDLCYVCAASPDDLPTALSKLAKEPQVITLAPTTLKGVWEDLLTIAEATRHLGPAADILADIRRRMQRIERAVEGAAERPRVACLEWIKPPYAGGHWVPDMVAHAGGRDVLGKSGEPSFEVTWEQVLAGEPDVIVICPCGFSLEEAAKEFQNAELPRGWEGLPAVKNGKVFVVNANQCFSRPSHRLITGVEILAELLHPGRLGSPIPEAMYRRLS